MPGNVRGRDSLPRSLFWRAELVNALLVCVRSVGGESGCFALFAVEDEYEWIGSSDLLDDGIAPSTGVSFDVSSFEPNSFDPNPAAVNRSRLEVYVGLASLRLSPEALFTTFLSLWVDSNPLPREVLVEVALVRGASAEVAVFCRCVLWLASPVLPVNAWASRLCTSVL